MVKQFSIVRDTQRGSQSYMENRRGRREIGVTRRRRGVVKRGENNLVSSHFPKCPPQPRTPREIQSQVEKRRGREEIEASEGETKGERGIKAVITPLCENGY